MRGRVAAVGDGEVGQAVAVEIGARDAARHRPDLERHRRVDEARALAGHAVVREQRDGRARPLVTVAGGDVGEAVGVEVVDDEARGSFVEHGVLAARPEGAVAVVRPERDPAIAAPVAGDRGHDVRVAVEVHVRDLHLADRVLVDGRVVDRGGERAVTVVHHDRDAGQPEVLAAGHDVDVAVAVEVGDGDRGRAVGVGEVARVEAAPGGVEEAGDALGEGAAGARERDGGDEYGKTGGSRTGHGDASSLVSRGGLVEESGPAAGEYWGNDLIGPAAVVRAACRPRPPRRGARGARGHRGCSRSAGGCGP